MSPYPTEPTAGCTPGVSRRDVLRWTGLGGLAAVTGGLLPASLGGPAWAADTLAFDPLRPPAVPLAVRSPYLSTWLPGDNLAGTWPTFWTGAVTAMTGIVRVDGTPYVFMGAPGGGYALATQTNLVTTATRSTYTIDAGAVTLTVTFLSPVDPANLQRQSVPMSYLTVAAASRDGGTHQVSVYVDISGEWAHGDNTQQVRWSQEIVGDQNVLTCTPASPSVLAETRDQASWGTVVWSTDNVSGLTWQTGSDSTVRTTAATTGRLPNTNDTNQPRAINNAWPVFGFQRDFGGVGAGATAPMVITIGHVRTPAVSYLGANLDPWWRTYWADWRAMLTWFRADLNAALAAGAATDTRIASQARQAAGGGTTGDQYAALCALAVRQAVAGTELVNRDGTAWAVLKEISSNGDFATVDVMYPASPAYLAIDSHYLELLLAPIFDYVENRGYPKQFAPHDLGVYPNAFGRINTDEEDMPVEESANMLIMTTAVLNRMAPDRATAYANQHYRILRQWAEYLVANLPDPGNQNQTDDFTGFIAHSVNLALKGIVGIAAMAEVATVVNNTADRDRYSSTARSYITRWVSMGRSADASHMRLTYDGSDSTWSLKYNGFADQLLNTNLVPAEIAAAEAAWYLRNQQAYGVLLDPRNDYTKLDWELWTAGFLVNYPEARNMLIGKAYSFVNTSGSRVPLTDWYTTSTGLQRGFAARPVIGGILALMNLQSTANGVTGQWQFDADQTLDTSRGARDLTAQGAGFTIGRTGRALSLDGATGYAASTGPVVRTDNSYTVTAWVKLDRTGQTATVVSQDGLRRSGFALGYSQEQNRWAFVVPAADADTAASRRSLSTAAPATGIWTHLAGVYNAQAKRITLYVNGIAQSGAALTGAWYAAGDLQIGRGRQQGEAAEFLPGTVDEVRTFDRAFSAADIRAAYRLHTDTLASFTLTEAAGGTAADAVGNHVLTLAGGVGWDTSGSGLSLATGGYAAADGSVVDTRASFTVAAWVNLSETSGSATVVSQDGAQASGFCLQYSRSDHAWVFAVATADGVAAPVTQALSPFPPKVGGWTHLVGVHDTGAHELRLYVNGRLAASVAHRGTVRATGPFAVGRGIREGKAVDFFPGLVDRITVWGRALSDRDVQTLG